MHIANPINGVALKVGGQKISLVLMRGWRQNKYI